MPKSYNQLLPSVERRLTAWVSLAQKHGGLERRRRPTITISRKFGCEAFVLSERLKEMFEAATDEPWNIYDKALLERVCQDEHLSMELLEHLGNRSSAADSIGFLFSKYVSHDKAFRCLARHLVVVAETGNSIIVGRGGAILARDLPNCYHFRLDASDQFCVTTIARRLEIPEKDATEMVREHDRIRETFIDHCLHASVRDVRHYHAVFNRDLSGIDEIARSIFAFVVARWEDKAYFKSAVEVVG